MTDTAAAAAQRIAASMDSGSAAPPEIDGLDLDGAEVLDEVLEQFQKFVQFPTPESAWATTLWVAASHDLGAFNHAPRLVIFSPEKRCGKSRLLDLIAAMCWRPLMSANASVAAIFRSLGGPQPPTLLIDEADAIFSTRRAADQHEDFRALLNAGHSRNRPALRCVGKMAIVQEHPTFAMAALAGIGKMPDTITDRAVNINMRRRRPDEKVQPYRERRDGRALAETKARLSAWALAHEVDLMDAEPLMPLEDRAADTWEPLIAMADCAGGAWPERARQAALLLVNDSQEEDVDRGLSTRLLVDLRDVFAETPDAFMSTSDILSALKGNSEAPWAELNLSARKLADRVGRYGVKSKRDTTGKVRGYRVDDFDDAFRRYLPAGTSETSVTVKPSDPQVATTHDVGPLTLAPVNGGSGVNPPASEADGLTLPNAFDRDSISQEDAAADASGSDANASRYLGPRIEVE